MARDATVSLYRGLSSPLGCLPLASVALGGLSSPLDPVDPKDPAAAAAVDPVDPAVIEAPWAVHFARRVSAIGDRTTPSGIRKGTEAVVDPDDDNMAGEEPDD